MADFISEQWHGMVAGGGLVVFARAVAAFVLRVKAAKMRGDGDPSNDGVADVLDDAASKVEKQ